MREGALLAKLINEAGTSVADPVAADTIWLTRLVCARASIFDGSREELTPLLTGRVAPPTVREFCATLGVDTDDSATLRAHAQSLLHEGDPQVWSIVIEELAQNVALREQIVASSAQVRQRLLEYLRRTLPPDTDTLVLVDLGWSASAQRLVERLLARVGSPIRTVGLYLLTYERAAGRALEGLHVEGFLGNCGVPRAPLAAIVRSPEILEHA